MRCAPSPVSEGVATAAREQSAAGRGRGREEKQMAYHSRNLSPCLHPRRVLGVVAPLPALSSGARCLGVAVGPRGAVGGAASPACRRPRIRRGWPGSRASAFVFVLVYITVPLSLFVRYRSEALGYPVPYWVPVLLGTGIRCLRYPGTRTRYPVPVLGWS